MGKYFFPSKFRLLIGSFRPIWCIYQCSFPSYIFLSVLILIHSIRQSSHFVLKWCWRLSGIFFRYVDIKYSFLWYPSLSLSIWSPDFFGDNLSGIFLTYLINSIDDFTEKLISKKLTKIYNFFFYRNRKILVRNSKYSHMLNVINYSSILNFWKIISR